MIHKRLRSPLDFHLTREPNISVMSLENSSKTFYENARLVQYLPISLNPFYGEGKGHESLRDP
jgi:hypothetical protein